MNGMFLAGRAIFIDFHPVWMGLLVFHQLIVFRFAFRTFQGELRSHPKTSIQSRIYCIILGNLFQAKNTMERCFSWFLKRDEISLLFVLFEVGFDDEMIKQMEQLWQHHQDKEHRYERPNRNHQTNLRNR